MTVVLLKELLRERNVTFKSNLPKKKLIQKVKEARQKLGDRSECVQNPHPFHQSNAHPDTFQ